MISIAALDAGGAHASGDLISYPGGFSGRLTLAGGTLGGTLDFAPAAGAQRIDAHLTANNASFPGAFAVRTGRIDGSIILADERTTLDGVVDARGVDVGGMTLARLTANAKLVNGSRPSPRRLHRPRRRRLCVLDASPTSRPTSFA